jgi:hypothetical protein
LKTLLIIIICTLSAFAQVHVKGYTRKDGTYVAPYIRSAPNATKTDNYGSPKNEYEKYVPTSRDNDNDYIPNYIDHDDDNDGINDDDDQYNDQQSNQNQYRINSNNQYRINSDNQYRIVQQQNQYRIDSLISTNQYRIQQSQLRQQQLIQESIQESVNCINTISHIYQNNRQQWTKKHTIVAITVGTTIIVGTSILMYMIKQNSYIDSSIDNPYIY